MMMNYPSKKSVNIFVLKWFIKLQSKNIVLDTNAFLLRPHPFAIHPHSVRLRSTVVRWLYILSSAFGRVQNRGRQIKVESPGVECGWNENGTRSCQERYFYCSNLSKFFSYGLRASLKESKFVIS